MCFAIVLGCDLLFFLLYVCTYSCWMAFWPLGYGNAQDGPVITVLSMTKGRCILALYRARYKCQYCNI